MYLLRGAAPHAFAAAAPLLALRHYSSSSTWASSDSTTEIATGTVAVEGYRTIRAHGVHVPVLYSTQPQVRSESPQTFSPEQRLRATTHARFLIIGGGVAGTTAYQTLLAAGVPAEYILTLSGNDGAASRAAAIDTKRSLVVCEDGKTVVHFERCLIACGSGPHSRIPSADSPHGDPEHGDSSKAPIHQQNAKRWDSMTNARRTDTSEFVDVACMEKGLVRPLFEGGDRRDFIAAAAAGEPVVVIGSSWYAVALAAEAADAARLHGTTAVGGEQHGRAGQPNVTLICPEAGPLARLLPRFLVISLAQRLSKRGVTIKSQSYVRYISYHEQQLPHINEAKKTPRASRSSNKKHDADSCSGYTTISTCKRFDSLDTDSFPATRVAIVDFMKSGARDSASVFAGMQKKREWQNRFGNESEDVHRTDPISSASDSKAHPLSHSSDAGRDDRSYNGESLEQFCSDALEVHTGLGGIVVNSELMASSRVFAAGDAAVFPHQGGRLGRCRGRGIDHAVHSGRTAALNMIASLPSPITKSANDTIEAKSMRCPPQSPPISTTTPLIPVEDATDKFDDKYEGAGAAEGWQGMETYDHIPVFRALAPPLGINLAIIGRCESSMETHSFWWQNTPSNDQKGTIGKTPPISQSSSASKNPVVANDWTEDTVGGYSNKSYGYRETYRTHNVAATTNISPLKKSEVRRRAQGDMYVGGLVHGSGVVFYMDPSSANEHVVGVMLWNRPTLASAAAAATNTDASAPSMHHGVLNSSDGGDSPGAGFGNNGDVIASSKPELINVERGGELLSNSDINSVVKSNSNNDMLLANFLATTAATDEDSLSIARELLYAHDGSPLSLVERLNAQSKERRDQEGSSWQISRFTTRLLAPLRHGIGAIVNGSTLLSSTSTNSGSESFGQSSGDSGDGEKNEELNGAQSTAAEMTKAAEEETGPQAVRDTGIAAHSENREYDLTEAPAVTSSVRILSLSTCSCGVPFRKWAKFCSECGARRPTPDDVAEAKAAAESQAKSGRTMGEKLRAALSEIEKDAAAARAVQAKAEAEAQVMAAEAKAKAEEAKAKAEARAKTEADAREKAEASTRNMFTTRSNDATKEAWQHRTGDVSTLTSELERWVFLNPLEQARLRDRVVKQRLLASLKTLATRLMVGDAYSFDGSARIGSDGSAKLSNCFSKDGAYQHTSASTLQSLGMGGGVITGADSFNHESHAGWTPAAAIGGESPFSSGRHGKAVGTSRSPEAFSSAAFGSFAREDPPAPATEPQS